MDDDSFLKNKKFSYSLYTLCLILLLLPNIIRINKGAYLISNQAYLHLHNAQYLGSHFNFYNLLIAPLAKTNFSFIINVILGLICIYLLFLLYKDRMQIDELNLCLLLLVISPFFMYLFSTLNSYGFIIVLFLLYLVIWESQIKFYQVYLFIISFILGMFGWMTTIIFLFFVLMIIVPFYFKHKSKSIIISYLISLIGAVVATLIFSREFTVKLFPNNIFSELIIDLGGTLGVSSFMLILLFIGVVFLWRKKFSLVFAFVFLLLWSIIFGAEYNAYLGIIIVIISVYGLKFLLVREWMIKDMKNFSILLIICGLIFTTITFQVRLIDYQPSAQVHEALLAISNDKDSFEINDTLLISKLVPNWDFGNSEITYAIPRTYVLTDKSISYVPLFYGLLTFNNTNSTINLWNTTRLQDAQLEMYKNEIGYVLITQEMRHRIWNDQDNKFVYLLQNNEIFKKAYKSEEVEAYWVQ